MRHPIAETRIIKFALLVPRQARDFLASPEQRAAARVGNVHEAARLKPAEQRRSERLAQRVAAQRQVGVRREGTRLLAGAGFVGSYKFASKDIRI